MKLFVVDNYDSFTYNIVHLVRSICGVEPTVKRNDCFDLSELSAYDKIILSPGPGVPAHAGNLMAVIDAYHGTKSLLGVCLGHQAIGQYFGGELVQLEQVAHGESTTIRLDPTEALFHGLNVETDVGRYHSWALEADSLPDCLRITAVDGHGAVMAIRHRHYDVTGVQFHPESILTPEGKQMMYNWLKPEPCKAY
ncbi:MAG: aminodeoxychorismate/anthranilate synthase component II [Sphingobacteriales bacterium]|nr:MAG: aminodeoxychorismate/anthranilate synthase component II [Sphingobacteriales bacterium]